MGFFSKIKKSIGNLKDQAAKFQNADFLDAVLWSCGLIAAADGKIDSNEVETTLAAIQSSPYLSSYKPGDVVESFDRVAKAFSVSLHLGKIPALQNIKKIAGNKEASETVVAIACAIGSADGDFDDKEKACAAEICKVLGVSKSDFGL